MIGTKNEPDKFIQSITTLPLNQETRVKAVLYQNTFYLYFNESLVGYSNSVNYNLFWANRLGGAMNMYRGHPSWSASSATISAFSLSELTSVSDVTPLSCTQYSDTIFGIVSYLPALIVLFC